ncbi:hypothetical protein [Sphingosinithalassobacter sp. CS137]|uniref:hypothetical protein n=1 Tax=Sphingosinithalassobacter sp. CS137 TaxID=2762748 RepID=UPI00165DC8C0|nr:hypothetical protein [Sphingosinithalassobacter sp. CS137]
MIPLEVIKALANVAIITQFSSWAELDEDAAVQMLEQMAGDLQMLGPDDLASLSEGFRKVSESYREAEVRQFVWELPSALGLENDEEDADLD